MHITNHAAGTVFDACVADAAPNAKIIDAQQKRQELRPWHGVDRKPRIILYSHDTMGLGHIRRNLLLAQALTSSNLDADVLLITGARESGRFNLPKGADVVVLPALSKDLNGKYAARHLGLCLNDLIAVRSQMVLATVKSFQPDLVIIDNVARGVNGELDQTLRYIRANSHIRCVLGLRDIRDEPEVVRREWDKQRYYDAIRNFYNEVWVYGDANVYDLSKEYNLPEDIVSKIRFTGYLDQNIRLEKCGHEPQQVFSLNRSNPFVLCMVGGGQDGAMLADSFIRAEYPESMNAIVITGPYMDVTTREALKKSASSQPHLKVLDFIVEPAELVRDASLVITMGGYNSICEVLSFEKPALVVPRVQPRQEQLIRAERLDDLGVITLMHPDYVSSQALSEWMKISKSTGSTGARSIIDMNGLQRIPSLITKILDIGAQSTSVHYRAIS